MKLLIISNYWHFKNEKSSSRYNSIAEMSLARNIDVELLTSSFYHTQKKQRNYEIECLYKATLINEPSYSKNITIKRIISHRLFANRVIKHLKNLKEKPDVIYLFVPPTGLAKKVVDFANRNKIKIIIDVLDLWPEAFEMILPASFQELLLPMKRDVEFAYKNADRIVAVSKGYANRAVSINKKTSDGMAVYIGTDLSVFDKNAENAPELDGKLRPITMAYIGMLGKSYDLIAVMQAMKELIESGFDIVEFLVMGNGPMQQKFAEYAKDNNLPVRFTGRLSYEDMVKKLVKCDFGVNALQGKSVAGIINKHADYLSAGIPIINIQKDKEFSDLLIENNAGIVCPIGDIESLKNAIKTLSENDSVRSAMGRNSRLLAEKYFDRNTTYKRIIDLIEELGK